MSKPTMTITAILMLLTGLALGHLGSLAMPRLQSVAPASANPAQELETARSFYDALNRFLVTGEPGIASMLAPEFVDYTGSWPGSRNAEQLMAEWSAIDSYLPNLRLDVVDVQVWGTLVAVRLEIHAGSPSVIPGVPMNVPVASSAVEFLRIEHARVAERWSSDDRLPGMAMMLSADFARTGPSLGAPAIQRLSLLAGQEIALSGEDIAVLRVISGELWLDRAAVDPKRGASPTSAPVASGQFRIVNDAGTLVLRNLSSSVSDVLVFSSYGLFPVDAADGATEGGEVLAYAPIELPNSPDTHLRLSVTELTLPPGASVAPHTPGLIEEIAVLEGALDVSVQSGRALRSAGDGSSRPFDGVETIPAGHGISASSIATLSYQVTSAQPVTLVIMTLDSAP